MLNGYSTIKNSNSVSASPSLYMEWNANKYGTPLVTGTSFAPGYVDNQITTYDFTTLSSGNNTTLSSRSASYSNIEANGKTSVFNDSTYSLASVSGNGLPCDFKSVIDLSNLFPNSYGGWKQEYYSIRVSFWVKSAYSSTNTSVTEGFDIFVKLDTPDSYSTSANRIAGTTVANSTHRVNSFGWTQVNIEYSPKLTSQKLKYLRIGITSESFVNSKIEFALDQLQVFRITTHQADKKNDFCDVDEIFKYNRPGEYLVRYKEDGISLGTNYSQPCHFVPRLNSGIENLSAQFNGYVATSDDQFHDGKNFKPYITNDMSSNGLLFGILGGSEYIWSIYDTEFSVNKIVMKQNCSATKTSARVWILTKSGATYTWVEIASPVTFNDNGIATLYYDGISSWGETKWSTVPNINSGSISNYKNICGVMLWFDQYWTATPGVNLINQSQWTYNKNRIEVVEISPRLQLDMSAFLETYSITKEMSSGDDPLPIGQATSNNLSFSLSNIPIVSGSFDAPLYSSSDDIIIFSNEAVTSPLRKYLGKDAQCFLYLNVSGSAIPQFTGYVNEWSVDERSAQIQSTDAIKMLQDRTLPSSKTTKRNIKVNDAIALTLRAAGINDFDNNALTNLGVLNSYIGNTINFYWAEKEENAADALDELAKVYQTMMYVDEYGKININSLENIMGSSTVSASITDKNSATELSNIVSVTESVVSIPKKVTINYSVPAVSSGITENLNGEYYYNTAAGIWEPQDDLITLSNTQMAKPLLIGDTELYIQDTLSFLNGMYDYEGYFMVDSEIIGFKGREHTVSYTTDNSTYYPYGTGVATIYSPEGKETLKNQILSASAPANGQEVKRVRIIDRGVLKNLRRGLFGTVEASHGINIPFPGVVNSLSYGTSGGYNLDLDAPGSITTNSFRFTGAVSNNITTVDNGATIRIKGGSALRSNIDWNAKGWNYFRSVQSLYNGFTTLADRVYTGVFLGGNYAGNNGLYVAVGRKKNGKYNQAVIIKNYGKYGVYGPYRYASIELNELNFGAETDFINPDSPYNPNNPSSSAHIGYGEAIVFEIWTRNTNNGAGLITTEAKIAINNSFITENAILLGTNNSGVSGDRFLRLSGIPSGNFGAFCWSAQPGFNDYCATFLYEMYFGKWTESKTIRYDGNAATTTAEAEMLNNIVKSQSTNADIQRSALANYNMMNENFHWTGSRNLRQMKIFDIELDQYPIQSGYSKIGLSDYQFNNIARKTNYL